MDVVRSARLPWILVALLVAVMAVVGLGRGGPAAVHAATETNTDTVTVTGEGTADGAPDSLDVDFTVSVTRATVQSALDAQAAATRRVFAALQHQGVARADIRTTDLSIDRHYDDHGAVTGYDASETVRVRIMPLRHAGATITAAATASRNDVSVGGMAFDLVHDDAVVSRARADAFADAKSRAAQYAELAGRSLGRVQKVTEQIDYPQPVTYGAFPDALTAAKSAAVPLRGGTQTLTVHVTVVWTLR